MTRGRAAAAGAAVLLWAVSVVVWLLFGTAGLLLVLAALVVGSLTCTAVMIVRAGRLLRALRAVSRDLTAVRTGIAELGERQDASAKAQEALQPVVENLYPQVESLVSLHSALRPQRPLPPLGGWAVSPDFMARAVAIVFARRPTTIVECGSGVSTVYLGLAVRRVGRGRVVSLDHKERFADVTRTMVVEQGLTDVVTVRYAPLRPVTIDGREWLWYDLDALSDVETCGLLVVDGPPRTVQDLARYPALPLLRDRLGPGALVLMDDFRRSSERRTVRRWRREHPGLVLRVHEHERVTAEIELPRG